MNFDDFELKSITSILQDYANTALEFMPKVVIALVVFFAFYMVSKLVNYVVGKLSDKITTDTSLRSLFCTLARVATVAVGILAAAAVIFPGLKAGDLIGVLGLSSVAIGFAFKDIFQNFLAGILILTQRPFKIGDQIKRGDIDGTVEDISIRSTSIRAYDGQYIVVPNSELFTNPVIVRTHHDKRRSVFNAGIAYDEDIEEARSAISEVLQKCEDVLQDPAPQVYVVEHGASSVNFEVRYWTKSDMASVKRVQDRVATGIKYAFDERDIEIPYPYRTVEFTDKTDYKKMVEDMDQDTFDKIADLKALSSSNKGFSGNQSSSSPN